MNQWCWQKICWHTEREKNDYCKYEMLSVEFWEFLNLWFWGYTCHRKKQSRRKTCALSHSPGNDSFFYLAMIVFFSLGNDSFFHLVMIVRDIILKFTPFYRLHKKVTSVNGCFLLLNTCSHRLPECVLPLMSFKGWVNPFCLSRVPVCVQHGRGLEVIFGNFGHCPEAI